MKKENFNLDITILFFKIIKISIYRTLYKQNILMKFSLLFIIETKLF